MKFYFLRLNGAYINILILNYIDILNYFANRTIRLCMELYFLSLNDAK